MKSNLPLNMKILALAYNGFTKSGMKESLKWAKKNWDDYIKETSDYYLFLRKRGINPDNITEKQAYKEFIFKGYVPREEYERNPDAWYIISTRPVLGVNFIYPKEYGHDYKSLQKLPDVYWGQSEVGIQGYTRVDIKYSL